jgi:hypothetical protein
MKVDYVEGPTLRGARKTRAKIRGVTTGWEWWGALRLRLLKIARSAKRQEFGFADRIGTGPVRQSLQINAKELEGHANEYREIIGLAQEMLVRIDPTKRNVLMRLGVFLDPPGSCALARHTDIYNKMIKCDFSVWQVMLPLHVPHGSSDTRFHAHEDPTIKFNNVADETTMTVFEAMQKHSAPGNKTSEEKLMLQLVFVTDCLLDDDLGRKEIREQFNNEKDIRDASTQVGYWLQNFVFRH